jgi:hypothetical protein
MAPLIAKAIKPIGKRRLQPLHASDEVSPRRFHREVEMIAHDHERMEQPLTTSAGREETCFKCGLGTRVREYPAAIIAAIDDVIDRAGEFEAKFVGACCVATTFGPLSSPTSSMMQPQSMGAVRRDTHLGKR